LYDGNIQSPESVAHDYPVAFVDRIQSREYSVPSALPGVRLPGTSCKVHVPFS